MTFYSAQITQACEYLTERLPENLRSPVAGVVCGSGIGRIAAKLENAVEFEYNTIPGFVTSTVQGHSSKLVFGLLDGRPVVAMLGRFHPYEGWSGKEVTFPIRVMIGCGITALIVTNAAGGVNDSYKVGDIMIFEDYIGLPLMAGSAANPLIGKNCDDLGPRFPPVTSVFTRELRKSALQAAHDLNLASRIKQGVYFMVSGPCYESRAEIRFLRGCGADAVGMSTLPEVAVAAHSGVKLLGLSLITNECRSYRDYVSLDASDVDPTTITTNEVPPSHEEVLEATNSYSMNVLNIVCKVISKL